LRIYSPTKFSDGVLMANFSEFSSPVFSSRRMQHISVMNSIKTIIMCGSMVDMQSAPLITGAEKKKEEKYAEDRNHSSKM